MPGIHLAHAPDVADRTHVLHRRLHSLLHLDTYEIGPVHEFDESFLAVTSYPEYPIEVVETDEYLVLLEGKLYDVHTELDDELTELAEDVFAGDSDAISDWLVDRDGVFLCVFVERNTERVAVLNDVMGRLPTYVAETSDGLFLSRELPFCYQSPRVTDVDRMGLAQMLLFGYTLGERTQFKAVRKLAPASLLLVEDTDVTETSIHTHNFETEAHSDRSIRENASELASLFSDVCQNRAERSGGNVVSLSGGLDSRALAACYHRNDTPFEAVTFSTPDGEYDEDVTVASELANELGVDWHYYELSNATGEDMQTLLEMKQGTNYLLMAWILPFFEQLQEDFGTEISYITGDGGQRALRDNTPSRTPQSLDELVDGIVSSHGRFSLEQVAKLTDIASDEIEAEIRSHVETYPEEDLVRKYVHYMIAERGINFQFPGEDRNRFYFWSEGPLFAAPFFRYAVNCPTDQKRDTKLYQEFLTQLWPESVSFDYVNVGAKPGSLEYQLKMTALDVIFRYPKLKDLVRSTIKGTWNYQYDSLIAECLDRQITSCSDIEKLLDGDEIRTLIDNRDSCGKFEIYTLLTVTSLLEHVLCSSSTLELFADQQFS